MHRLRLLIFLISQEVRWVEALKKHGHQAVYWTNIGAHDATDETILEYAAKNDYVLFTNDLDFGTLLFHRKSKIPSVIQIRGGWLLPETALPYVVSALEQCKAQLGEGALLVLTEDRSRIRLLPLE
jgi:predicted nuclease of predicted toxin-antitoxin system